MLVLETDYTFKSVSERKGGTVGKILHDVFAEAGRQHEPPCKNTITTFYTREPTRLTFNLVEIETIMKFVVEDEGGQIPPVNDLDDINAVLLTGSKYDAHGDDKWILKLLKWIQGEKTEHSLTSSIRQVLY